MNFIDSLPSIVFSAYLSSEGEITFASCNDRLNHFFGISPNQLLDDASLFFNPIKQEHREHIKNAIKDSITRLQSSQIEFEILSIQNNSLWLLLQTSPEAKSVHGKSVCGIISNINSLQHAKLQAIETANYFMHMQDQLSDRFYFKDRNSRFLGGNKAWYEFHGFTRLTDAIGKSDANSRNISESDKREILEQEQEMMRTGIPIHKREKHVNTAGLESFADSKKVPLYNATREIIGLVGLTRDITELVVTEKALEKAKQDAEQAAKAKSSFLAVMSHEIRTPMNGVIGCASLLSATNLTAEQEQLVHTIQSSGECLLVLINDILDYSKIEAGKMNLERSPFQLRLLIEDCIELFSKQVADKQLEINYYMGVDVPARLIGDATRIRQIINNLIGNAVKFTHQGEVFVDVSLATIDKLTNRCTLNISIQDTGIGISAENQNGLFNAFSQADSSITRRFGGTGLGLVICKKIVEQMEGDIWFKSAEGKGTTFYVNLPLNFDLDQVDENYTKEIATLKGLRVLIVDDNATNRKVLANTLMQWEIIPVAFDSPDNALENLSLGNEYDLVLLDFCMPNSNGANIATKIKQMPCMHNKPIVLLSGANTAKSDLDSIDVCLLKPVRNSILKKTISQVLGHSGTSKIIKPKVVELAPSKNTKILVVEDNAVNQMVIAMMLKKLGYHNFSLVADGEEAVEQCKKINFDIIFMDIQMVRMDGYTAAQLIRQHTQSSMQPWIIALTAGAQREDSEKAFSAGMNSFTTKPIQLDGLKSVLAVAEDAISQQL